MQYHRKLKLRCLHCEADGALPKHPYFHQVVTCKTCGAKMRYDHASGAKENAWLIVTPGKPNLDKKKIGRKS